MTAESLLPCDGCGQPGSSQHISRRLKRLEWTTRYRPVHIGTLLLGAVAPKSDHEFLYSPSGEFQGEAGLVLQFAGVSSSGKPAEVALAEFQRAGMLLTHVLECALERPDVDGFAALEQRLTPVIARIRRSLKPKRVVLISEVLQPFLDRVDSSLVGCPVSFEIVNPAMADGKM